MRFLARARRVASVATVHELQILRIDVAVSLREARLQVVLRTEAAGAAGVAGPCDNKSSGVEGVNLDVNLDSRSATSDPKCTGFPNFLPPEACGTQQIGSFEFEVQVRHGRGRLDILLPKSVASAGSVANQAHLLFVGARMLAMLFAAPDAAQRSQPIYAPRGQPVSGLPEG